MAITRHVTAEELWEMPEQPGVRFELVEGALLEVPTAGALHNLIVRLVSALIDQVVVADDRGLVFTDGTGYLLRRRPDLLRIPDVSFISWERLPGGQAPEGFMEVAPDLAIEVVSPNDRADDAHSKVHEYLEAGTRLVWILWPRRQSVSVHEPGAISRELDPDDYLDGGEVLPGFRVRVAELFRVQRERRLS